MSIQAKLLTCSGYPQRMRTYVFMEFAYKKIGTPFSPIIPLKIHHHTNFIATDALIDSGSNLSIFRMDVAEKLGINCKSGQPVHLSSVNEIFIGYVHSLHISIGDLTLPCHVVFAETFKPNLNIVGRIDFFDHFLITFDERNKKLTLTNNP